MKDFDILYQSLDNSTESQTRIDALVQFFSLVDDRDKIWAIALLTQNRPKRIVKQNMLRYWVEELAQIDSWLFEESHRLVGDLSETIALLAPLNKTVNKASLSHWIEFAEDLRSVSENHLKDKIIEAWSKLDSTERYLFNKLVTGGFRLTVSERVLVQAVAFHTKEEETKIAHRLLKKWNPRTTSFKELFLEESSNEKYAKPYPFFLAYHLADEPDALGSTAEWYAEWKWDGQRSQMVLRNGEAFVWSSKGELLNESFPEFKKFNSFDGPSFVLDGQLVIIKDGIIQDFHLLQKRLVKKKASKKLMSESPAAIIAYDLLEYEGEDIRHLSQEDRRAILEELFDKISEEYPLFLSDLIEFDSWDQIKELRETARENYAEGLVLKSKKAKYEVSRIKGSWWKWKLKPMTIDAVLIYAQRSQGRGTGQYIEYTFAVWKDDILVPFVKTYDGLEENEHKEIAAYVKENTIERFGPVVSMVPGLVFQLSFDGIARSNRHKSRVILRSTRILQWYKERPAEEANQYEELLSHLK